MPGDGMPTISKENLIMEYPSPVTGSFREPTGSEIRNMTFMINENLDRGHRHFSSMHWLYPNAFVYMNMGFKSNNTNSNSNSTYDQSFNHNSMNINKNNLLVSAAKNTMAIKKLNNGGHTSWSASWQASLYARLGMIYLEALTPLY